ncbi:MAG: type II secretion system protein GspD, partial [Nitrospirae bacterium]
VRIVSDLTGVNIVYNPKMLRGTVTIRAKKPFSKGELLDILKSVLEINNYAINREKGILYVVDKRGAARLAPRFRKEGELEKDSLTVTVFQVENIDVKELTGFLNIIKSDIGRFVVMPKLNTVVVKDRGENLKSMARVIESLASMGKEVMVKIYKLKYVQAADLNNSLKGFFVGLNKLNFTRAVPVFMVDNASNSLVVAALPQDLSIIENIIEKVDREEESATFPRVFKLKYARAEDVEKIINKMLTGNVTGKQRTAQAGRIIVAADKSTNTLSVIGDPDTYAKVQALIEKLDIPRDQIFVEALIIETTLEEGSKFGIEWLAGGGNENMVGTGTFINEGNVIDLQSPVLEGNPPNLAALPGGFNLGILGNIITYEGVKFPTLSALVNAIKSKSGINILSKPQLLTLDNEEAEVFVGENRPYLISTKFDANNNPVQTFDYRDVGIKLKILPHLVDSDTILLNIYQEVKKVIASASGETSAPITLTRSTNTTVKIRDNTTIVISGLIKNDESVTEKKIPLLGDIPILGALFRSTEKSSEKTNMMVFINTRVIRTREGLSSLTREKSEELGEKGKKEIGDHLKKDTDKGPDKEGKQRDKESETDSGTGIEPEGRMFLTFKNSLRKEEGFSLNLSRRLDFKEIEPYEIGSAEKTFQEKALEKQPPPMPVYSVQVGYFLSERNARTLLRGLQEHGYSGEIRQDGRGYRVLIGRFNSIAPASYIKHRLKKREGLEAFIYQVR